MPKEFTMCQTKVVEIYETIFKLRDFSYEIFTILHRAHVASEKISAPDGGNFISDTLGSSSVG